MTPLGKLVLTASGLLLFALCFISIRQENLEKEFLMAECRADGRKEYECHALINGNTSTHSTIFIPMKVR